MARETKQKKTKKSERGGRHTEPKEKKKKKKIKKYPTHKTKEQHVTLMVLTSEEKTAWNSRRGTQEHEELLGKTVARHCACEGHVDSLAISPTGHVGR